MTIIWFDPIEEARENSVTAFSMGLVVEADMEIVPAAPEPEPETDGDIVEGE